MTNWVCLSFGLALILGVGGCGKREEAPSPAVSERSSVPSISAHETSLVPGDTTLDRVVESTVDEAKRRAEAAEQTVKDEVERVTEAARETVEAVTNEAQAAVESLLEQVRALLAEQKYLEAGEVLGKLVAMELTPEQREQVDAFKTELEKKLSVKGIEAAGRKALGGLLDGKR
jgi:hypothetical protein